MTPKQKKSVVAIIEEYTEIIEQQCGEWCGRSHEDECKRKKTHVANAKKGLGI